MRRRLQLLLDENPVAAPVVGASLVALLAVVLAAGSIPRRVWRPYVPKWARTNPFAGRGAKTWTLGLGEGSAADLTLEDDGRGARVVVKERGGVEAWRIQLNRGSYSVEPEIRYVLRFRARADEPREVSVGLARNHSPWDSFGITQTMDLATEWRSYEFNFVSSDGDTRTRVYFNLAAAPVPVEVGDLTLALAEDQPSPAP
jgi:hypothetical protein